MKSPVSVALLLSSLALASPTPAFAEPATGPVPAPTGPVVTPTSPVPGSILGTWLTRATPDECAGAEITFYRLPSTLVLTEEPAGSWDYLGLIRVRNAAQEAADFHEGEVSYYLNKGAFVLGRGQSYTGYSLFRESWAAASWVETTIYVNSVGLTIDYVADDTEGCDDEGHHFSRAAADESGTPWSPVWTGHHWYPTEWTGAGSCDGQRLTFVGLGDIAVDEGEIAATYNHLGINVVIDSRDALEGVMSSGAPLYLAWTASDKGSDGTVTYTFDGFLFSGSGSGGRRTGVDWTAVTLAFEIGDPDDTSTWALTFSDNYSPCGDVYAIE